MILNMWSSEIDLKIHVIAGVNDQKWLRHGVAACAAFLDASR